MYDELVEDLRRMHCKHRDGSGVHHVNGYWYRLPYCKVCDADMTIIYEPPCREFEAEEGE